MNIGQRIKLHRQKRKLSQQKLADMVGINQSMIFQLESGMASGSKHIGSIAHALGVNARWLETGIGQSDIDYTEPVQIEKTYHPETEAVIKLIESTDEIGRGKVLYAVKEIVEMRKIMTNSIQLAFDEQKINKSRGDIQNWQFNVNNQLPPKPPERKEEQNKK